MDETFLKKRLDSVLDEPQSLLNEERACTQELNAALYEHFPVISEAIKAKDAIHADIQTYRHTTTRLQETTQSMHQSCVSFSQKNDELSLLRLSGARVAEKTDTLSALLDIPAVMDDLVGLGCYDEAIDLVSFVTRLKGR